MPPKVEKDCLPRRPQQPTTAASAHVYEQWANDIDEYRDGIVSEKAIVAEKRMQSQKMQKAAREHECRLKIKEAKLIEREGKLNEGWAPDRVKAETKWREEKAELQKEHEQAIIDKQTRLDNESKRADDANAERARLRDELAECETAKSTLESELATECGKVKEAYQEKQKEIKAQNTRINGLEIELKEAKSVASDRETKYLALNQQAERQKNEIEELKAKTNKAESNEASAVEKVRTLENDLQDAQQKQKAVAGSAATYQARCAVLESSNAELREKVDLICKRNQEMVAFWKHHAERAKDIFGRSDIPGAPLTDAMERTGSNGVTGTTEPERLPEILESPPPSSIDVPNPMDQQDSGAKRPPPLSISSDPSSSRTDAIRHVPVSAHERECPKHLKCDLFCRSREHAGQGSRRSADNAPTPRSYKRARVQYEDSDSPREGLKGWRLPY